MRSTYHVKQERFEGPLDLLLELIQREKLAINEISLALVTEGYLSEVKKLEMENGIDQEALAEFLVIAAQLMLVKSRALLPQFQLSAEEELSLGDLERRLQEYARIKELALELRAIERRRMPIASREAFLGRPAFFFPPPRMRVPMLADAFAAILRTIPALQEIAEERIKKVISLDEKIREIRASLASRLERAFSELIKGSKEKVEVIVSFLAILELAKQKTVSLHQEGTFEDIIIKPASS